MAKIVTGYRDSSPYGAKGSETCLHFTLESFKNLVKLQGAQVKGCACFEVTGEFVRDEGGSDGLVVKWQSYREFCL
jgi:hypothetical protein